MIGDIFSDIWDAIVDGFQYIISFEWLSDVWEFITSMFENLAEFSIVGAVLGLIGAGIVFVFRNQMLTPFLIHMGPIESAFWMIATYLGTFMAGYLMGKHFENT